MRETVHIKSSDGVKLAAHISGDGPPLYVLHGGPANDHHGFGEYLDPIAGYRSLHLLDQRGCGDSEDAPPESYTVRRLGEDVEDTRVGLGHDRIEILGSSYGGIIGLTYALRWPERVGRLLLVSSPIRGWVSAVLSPVSWPLWVRAALMAFTKNPDWRGFHLKYEAVDRARAAEAFDIPKRYDPARIRPLNTGGARPFPWKGVLKAGMPLAGIYGKQDRRFIGEGRYLRSQGVAVAFIDDAGQTMLGTCPTSTSRNSSTASSGSSSRASSARSLPT